MNKEEMKQLRKLFNQVRKEKGKIDYVEWVKLVRQKLINEKHIENFRKRLELQVDTMSNREVNRNPTDWFIFFFPICISIITNLITLYTQIYSGVIKENITLANSVWDLTGSQIIGVLLLASIGCVVFFSVKSACDHKLIHTLQFNKEILKLVDEEIIRRKKK